MKTILYNLLKPYHYRHAVRELQRLECRLTTSHLRVAIPFIFKGKGFFKSIGCMQHPEELQSLYGLVEELQPRRLIEIGTAKGGALYLWMQVADENALAVSVDLPGGKFGGGYHRARIPLYQTFCKERQKLHLIRANSHAPETVNQVKDIFHPNPVDFLFIDGDHTYEGVKKDFEDYAPLVRSGGIIAIHDILPRAEHPDIEVHLFWKELQKKCSVTELVGMDKRGRPIGCGVLKVPSKGFDF